MASEATIKNFIAEIAPCAQKAYKVLGKVKPSVCIGMACVESAYGTSKIMRQHHAFLGHKVGSGRTALKYWDGSFFVAKTKEEYKIGQHVVIKDAFRSFKNTEQCIFNFYELLNTSLYSRVKAESDYKTQMKQIKACGYMTSSTEVSSVLKLIEKYQLFKYDSDEIVDKPNQIKINPYKRTSNLIKRGMKGEDVFWLQWELNRHGASLVTDGDFGRKTLTAVISFQQKHPPLKVDGVVGPKTIAELEK